MRKNLLVGGIAAAALIPSLAFAQQTCEQRSQNRTVGTIAGAGLGALLGSAIAGHGDKTTGAVIGGLGGAFAGNQLAKGSADCIHAYGYYDKNSEWHANAVPASNATGYYDRDGVWVEGAPNGHYDNQNRWIAARADGSSSGYYAANNMWVPASAAGYYNSQGDWIAGAASGHYDSQGRWINTPTVGAYDASGRWVTGQAAGHRNSQGQWIADPQPGYYDNGVWHAGQTYGYYDAHGTWQGTAAYAGQQGSPASYTSDRYRTVDWNGAPSDLRSRESWLQDRIRAGMNSGALTQDNGRRALYDLNRIMRDERSMSRNRRGLSYDNQARLQARLDDVSASLVWQRGDRRRRDD